jgi:serine/threonine-protein kinase
MASSTTSDTIEQVSAYDDTVAVEGPGVLDRDGALVSAAPASLGAASSRTTVLPRVELSGVEPRLVHDSRERYERLAHLGDGGVGEVSKARDNDIGRTVAVKRLLPKMRAPTVLVRFMEEIRTIGRLEHPNIVPIHDVGVEEGGDYYFVMKYVDGETLESIIEKLAAGDPGYHSLYPFERRMEIFEGVLEALHYAHASGVVHRDIKPANIMIGRYGEVMVMDWGIARQLRADGPEPREVRPQGPRETAGDAHVGQRKNELFRTRAGTLIGTPAYMSPEQARGEPVDGRSDVYSACILLHELLSLSHPLEGKQNLDELLAAVKDEPVANLITWTHPHQSVVPADLAWFVHKGLAKDPAARYQSVAEMIDRLRRRKEGWIPIQCQITFSLRVANIVRSLILRHPLVLTIGMLLTVIATIGLVWKAVR